jgi:hypothetical protein
MKRRLMMSKSLPTAPNLEHLKKQAKDLRKSHRNRNPECCEALRLLRGFANSADEEIFDSKLSLNEAQMAVALDYGFKSWGDLKKHVLGRTENTKYLHIHCGDSSAQSLRNSSVPGDVKVWREIYIEGPVPGNEPNEEFCKARARFISSSMNLDYDSVLQNTREMYHKLLPEAEKYEEVVLWFDSCMFDQTIMIHLIDQCAQQNWPETKLSLICVDQGLGALPSEELASLMEIRHEITPEEITLAQKAWKAFTSAPVRADGSDRPGNPADIEELLAGDCSALPFLADALYRHLEQYPSIHNGLNRSEKQILQAVANGASKLGPIFAAATGDVEEHPFMGDTSCWGIIQNLAESKVPVLKVTGPDFSELTDFNPDDYEPPKNLKRWDVSITDTGRDVLAGKQDYIKLNGIDKWLGGVHLQGPESQWRWDEENRKLVRSSNAKPVAEKSKTKNQGAKKMKMDKMEFEWNGHRFDTFSQIVVAAGKILGKELEYRDVSCYATSNFAPSIQLNESCTDWWHMNKKPAMDLVGKAAGLKFEKLEYPEHNFTEWTDEEVEALHGMCAPVIKQALDEGKILITEGGWSNPQGKPFYPWCFWGIVTDVDEDGTITGIGINNRDDNVMKWISQCWIVSAADQDQEGLNQQLFERVLARIRGDEAPYLSDNEMAYGLDAMDKWIGKMKAEHFCDDCFKSAPDREWTCARGSALTMFQGARDSSLFLKEKMDYETIAGNYDRIAELLEPALNEDSDTAYKTFIGNRDKQIEHAETVLEPVKEELAKVADEIDKALTGG